MSGYETMVNNYGAGRMDHISAPRNSGGYYNSYDSDMSRLIGAGNPSCYFPAPPPKRVYCSPAPFTNPLGMGYQRLVGAYGNSRAHY